MLNTSRSWLRSASTALSMFGYCSLQASLRPSGAVARWTWPSEAAAAASSSNSANRLAPAGPQLGRHAAAHERPAHRRRVGLQLGELGGVFLGQRLRDRRQQLRDLHQRPLEAAERRPQLLGMRGAVDVDAEEARAREPRRQAAHRAGHPGVAPHPSGERVLRPAAVALGHAQRSRRAGHLALELVDQRPRSCRAPCPRSRGRRHRARTAPAAPCGAASRRRAAARDSAPGSPRARPRRPRRASSPGSRRTHRRRRRTAHG